MKKIVFLIITATLFYPALVFAQTKFEASQPAGQELKKAEAKLNKIYKEIMDLYNYNNLSFKVMENVKQ